MATIATIENGVKVIREATPEDQLPEQPTDAERLAAWRLATEITRLELAFALRSAAVLTQSEAVDFAGFGLPAPILSMLATMPAEVLADAELTLAGARDFPRSDAFWDALGAAEGWPTDTDIDTIFGWAG